MALAVTTNPLSPVLRSFDAVKTESVQTHRLWQAVRQRNCKPGTVVHTDAKTLLAAWYGCKEGADKHDATGLWLARNENGHWSAPECLYFKQPEHVWNPVLLKMKSGRQVRCILYKGEAIWTH